MSNPAGFCGKVGAGRGKHRDVDADALCFKVVRSSYSFKTGSIDISPVGRLAGNQSYLTCHLFTGLPSGRSGEEKSTLSREISRDRICDKATCVTKSGEICGGKLRETRT